MIRTIYIKDENPDRYTLRTPTHILGKTYDNNAEKIKVIFPAVEIEKSSACTMLVFANGEQIDSISVSNNIPFDITNVLSRHKEIEIGFRFTNSDDYVKNCDFDTFYFKEVKQPEPFTPESPEQESQINTLLGQGFVNIRWKSGTSNQIEFLNLSGGVQHTITIADATTSASGFMSASDKTKLAGLADIKEIGDNLTLDENGKLNATGGGGGGSDDYQDLNNKPSINNVTLSGNKSSSDLGLQPAGNYALVSEIPTKTSDLQNDIGFITGYTETDPVFSASASAGITGSDISNWNNKSDFSGSFNDLTDKPTIPDELRDLSDDSTHRLVTDTEKATWNNKSDFSGNYNDLTNKPTIPDVSDFITKNVNDLTYYTLKTNTGSLIDLEINQTTYVITLSLKDQDGNVISTDTIDLPLENVVISGSYDSVNQKIVLTLQSGNTVDIPVGALVAGLQSEITSTNKLASDLVDDTNSGNKFVTTSEKATWNGKQNTISDLSTIRSGASAGATAVQPSDLATVATSGSYNDLSNTPSEVTESTVSDWGFTKNTGTYSKPSGGIPSSDLASEVQTSLSKADSALQAHQDISSKEDKSNKITTFNSSISDVTKYPNAKSVVDFLGTYLSYGEKDYTNMLTPEKIYINKRWNSSGVLTDAIGYVAIDDLPFTVLDVLRINRDMSVLTAVGKNCRCTLVDSSHGTIAWGDGIANRYTPVVMEDGSLKIDLSKKYQTAMTPPNTSPIVNNTYTNIAYIRLSLYIKTTTVTDEEISDLIVTKNQKIIETNAHIREEIELPRAEALISAEAIARQNADLLLSQRIDGLSGARGMAVYAPSPQKPADGSSEADFNATTVGANDIYNKFDELVAKYPNYITKEIGGKDANNEFDLVRYVLCKHYFNAWCQENHPKMYCWKNGTTKIYSSTVSPNIGATMYSTTYIGTSAGTVSSVDNVNDTRTVGGTVYTRSKTDDIEPTLVYTSQVVNKVLGAGFSDNGVYDITGTKITTITSIDGTSITTESKSLNGNVMIANSITYNRYPYGDLDGELSDSLRSSTKYKPLSQGKKVVIIGANEHGPNGDPREPAICSYRLAKDLCECVNADNQLINYLKSNIKVIIVPVINPYGFTYGGANNIDGYFNKNGVNINRNYDTKSWITGTGSDASGDYGGSEVETRWIMDTYSESKDAIVGISVHCLGAYASGTNDGLMAFQGNNFEMNKLGDIAENLKSNYNITLVDYGWCDPDTIGQAGKSPAYITKAGLKGGIIEMNAREGYVGQTGNALHSSRILEADYTWLLSAINMWMSEN